MNDGYAARLQDYLRDRFPEYDGFTVAGTLELTARADRASPRFSGAFGSFMIVRMDPSEPQVDRLCQYAAVNVDASMDRIQQSELYARVFVKRWEAYQCPDGMIAAVGGAIRHAEASVSEFGHYYFTGEAIVEVEVRRGKRIAPQKEAMVHFVGLVAILTFALVITYFDVLRIFHGDGIIR